MIVSMKRGTPYRPQNTTVLSIAKWEPYFWETFMRGSMWEAGREPDESFCHEPRSISLKRLPAESQVQGRGPI